jgi:hypothetical protein
MQNDKHPSPRRYLGVMISSTFTDLQQHRAALIRAIKGEGLTDVAMENDSARPDADVIDSSLQMVRDASAYVGVISHKYGQTPACPRRNPGKLSLTELEFNEAQRLERPILLFIMGDDHLVRKADVETDCGKKEKLNAFRERAKQMKPDLPVHRVYAVFDSLEDFNSKAIHAVAALRRYLDEKATPSAQPQSAAAVPTAVAVKPTPIPMPPTFYAEPHYIGSHDFVGRQAQLEVLSDWALAADPHPVLLFDAIGGSGKSMLAWEWTTKHATQIRDDWAGRFWYSFYERGAIMADFCQRALAYITNVPLENFRRMKTLELGERLFHHLQSRPWLVVLDGLERVLVAYHRFDAAQVPDEEANKPSDQIGRRDPCVAIRPEDDDLLRALAAADPSKLLITSRLVPRVLLNPASQPIPGVLRVSLPGLRPADAEALLRSCGVTGASQAIQNYLKNHCDCHPLVTGVLAGLINDYLPDKGNFDTWVADPAGGGQLNFANIDLIQKRNHILNASLDAIPQKSRQLLSTLALLSEAVDYPALCAFNPHLPPEPEEVKKPQLPEKQPQWAHMSNAEKEQAQQVYQAAFQRRQEYEEAVEARLQSPEFLAAPQELANTVHDLERRGLLQYDAQTRRYDLHPVVRGIAAGRLRPEEKDRYGQCVVDYFSEQPHSPYDEAETLEDVRDGLHIVHTLLKMGRYQQACDAIHSDLARALVFNLESYAETLSLLRPFFSKGWATLPKTIDEQSASYLANTAGVVLYRLEWAEDALAAYSVCLFADLGAVNWAEAVVVDLLNISKTLSAQNCLAKEERCVLVALELAELGRDKGRLFRARLRRFRQLSEIGQRPQAEAMWQLLNHMGRNWTRGTYRLGEAEHAYAVFQFSKGDLHEEHLAHAEQLARSGKNRSTVRRLHALRGRWLLEQGRWALAAKGLQEAVRMARAIGTIDAEAETQLALAKFHLDQLPDPRREAEELESTKPSSRRFLTYLWLAIGDHEQARKHALATYKWAWADGEPYVHRYELDKITALLTQLGAQIPDLPRYDPAKDEKFPWEDKVAAGIEKLRAEKQAEKRKQS